MQNTIHYPQKSQYHQLECKDILSFWLLRIETILSLHIIRFYETIKNNINFDNIGLLFDWLTLTGKLFS